METTGLPSAHKILINDADLKPRRLKPALIRSESVRLNVTLREAPAHAAKMVPLREAVAIS